MGDKKVIQCWGVRLYEPERYPDSACKVGGISLLADECSDDRVPTIYRNKKDIFDEPGLEMPVKLRITIEVVK